MAQQMASDIVQCRYCDKEYRARGIASHERSCRSRNLPGNNTAMSQRDPLNVIVERNQRAGSLVPTWVDYNILQHGDIIPRNKCITSSHRCRHAA
jgi:hypothetical protein